MKTVCAACPSSGMFLSFSAFFPPSFNVCHLRESRGAAPVCLLASLSTSCPGLPLTPGLLWDALHMCMCACELWVWRKDSCRARQSLTKLRCRRAHTHTQHPFTQTDFSDFFRRETVLYCFSLFRNLLSLNPLSISVHSWVEMET